MTRWVVGLVLFWGVFIQHPPIDRISYNTYKKVLKANRLCPNIHYGGCGYYAYYLSGKLSGSTIVSIRSGMHYMVYRDGCYWDNSGVYLPHVIWLWSKGDIEPISREELRGLLNNRTLWNSRFDLMDTSAIITKIYKSK